MKFFKLIIGIFVVFCGVYLFIKIVLNEDKKFVVLFAPYRIEQEFLDVLPVKDYGLAHRLASISNDREEWRMVIISKTKLEVFSLNEVQIEPPTNSNKGVIIWRQATSYYR